MGEEYLQLRGKVLHEGGLDEGNAGNKQRRVDDNGASGAVQVGGNRAQIGIVRR